MEFQLREDQIQVLSKYEEASGQKINVQKSLIFFSLKDSSKYKRNSSQTQFGNANRQRRWEISWITMFNEEIKARYFCLSQRNSFEENLWFEGETFVPRDQIGRIKVIHGSHGQNFATQSMKVALASGNWNCSIKCYWQNMVGDW